MTLMPSATTLFALSLALDSFFCLAVSSESFPKNGFHSADFETNSLFDPPSRLSFKHKDFLDFMDKELEKLSLKTAFEKEDENYGYRSHIDTSLKKVHEQQNVENITVNQNTTKENETRTSVSLENFIDKSITNGSEAESNNHVSHLNPAPGYNVPSSEVIVKELGNSALNSAGYQDKVVYVPIYDTPNPQPGKSYPNQNFIRNDLNSGTHQNQNRKTIGFIGVVFVHKVPEDDIAHTQTQNNFEQHNQGVLQHFQDTQPTYSDAPGDFQNKFENGISFDNVLPQQVGNSGLNEETYRIRQQKTSGNYPDNSVPIIPNNEQWKVQKQIGNVNGWEANSGVKYAHNFPQGQTFSQKSVPWTNAQNQKLSSSQNAFLNKGNIPQGNSKMNKNGKQNFDSTRQIPENPLFPARGNAKPKNSPVSKFSGSNKQTNNLHYKNNIASNARGLHPKQQSNNYPNLNQQQNIHLNEGIYSNELGDVIAISDGKGSDQYIPVIKHVVIEKQVQPNANVHLLPSSGGGDILNDNGAEGGVYQNIQNFEQIEQHIANPTPQNLGVSYVTNIKKSGPIPSIGSSAQSQWVPRPNNQINRSPQIQYVESPQKLVQLEQYTSNNEKSFNDQIYKNFQSKNRHHENQNRQKFNQASVGSNSNTQHPFFENISNLNANQNPHEHSRQQQSYNSGPSLNQEFSIDPEIREAFRVAGIYLQNQGDTVPRHNGNNAAPHHPLEKTDSNQVYSQEVKNSQDSLTSSNNIRPTTDQRYNAYYHERNNNLNIIRLRDKLLQNHQNDPVQHFNNEMQKYVSFNGTNIFHPNLGNPVAAPHEIKMKIQGETPNQNGWEVIQNIKNTQSSVTYQNDANSNDYDRSKMNPTPEYHFLGTQRSNPNRMNEQQPRDRAENSFQIKDTVTHPQQRSSIPQNFNSNHNHPGQQLYNRVSQNPREQRLYNNEVQTQSRNSAPQKKDDTSKQNEGVLVFTGYGKQDLNEKSRYNHNTNQAYPQQHGQFRQGNHYKEDDSVKVGQRPPVSVIGTSNRKSDHHDKTAKAWYKRDLENTNNNLLKKDDGKFDNSNDYVIKDADGTDPNGFGGESFW